MAPALHFLLDNDDASGDAWDTIPSSWKHIRFDPFDVLFIAPLFVQRNTCAVIVATDKDGGHILQQRLEWLIRAARTSNPNIKIILEAFPGNARGLSDFRILTEPKKIQTYAHTLATMIGSAYRSSFEVGEEGSGKMVSSRIDGFDVDSTSRIMESKICVDVVKKVKEELEAFNRDYLKGEAEFSVCDEELRRGGP